MAAVARWRPQIGAVGPEDVDNEDEFPRIDLVRDVLVIPSPGHRANEQEWIDDPPTDGPVDLGNGVFLQRLRASRKNAKSGRNRPQNVRIGEGAKTA